MSSSANKKLRFLIIGLFAIGIFAIATFIFLESRSDANTVTPLQYLRRNKNGTEEVSSKIADAGLTNEELGLVPIVTTDKETSQENLDSSTDFSDELDPLATQASSPTEPFYANRHWLVLIGDAIFIAILTVILLIRLVSKLFSQPIDVTTEQSEVKNSNKVLTVDELDVDIPV